MTRPICVGQRRKSGRWQLATPRDNETARVMLTDAERLAADQLAIARDNETARVMLTNAERLTAGQLAIAREDEMGR